VAFDGVNASRDEDTGGNIAGVPSPFACLGTDDVDTGRKCFRNVLRVSDHVHYLTSVNCNKEQIL
jgi:hypothetical protein